MEKKIWKFRFFLAYVTPRSPLSVHNKFQPNRSSRLAGYREHIYECLVLYRLLAEGPGVARGKINLEEKKIWNFFFGFFLAYVTPRPPLSVHKKFQPNQSSRLADYREHIHKCLVLLYKVTSWRARRCPWKKNFKIKKKNVECFFSLCHPPTTHECPQKNSAQSVQPFGRL